jgi:hypothetical protein
MTGRRRALAPFALLVLLLLAACSARRIREAQDAFNQAATAEQQIEAMPTAGVEGLRGSSSAASGYAVALGLLDEELTQNEAALRQEDLLGTALVLKALCLWRIEALTHDTDGASPPSQMSSDEFAAIEAKASQAGVVLGTRDRVLLAALPGLREHDRALRAADYATASRFFRSAFTVMGSALDTVKPPPNHPVRAYIRLAQMRTLRAWLAANYAMNGRNAQETRAIHDAFHQVADALAPQIDTTPGLKTQIGELAKALGTTYPRQ